MAQSQVMPVQTPVRSAWKVIRWVILVAIVVVVVLIMKKPAPVAEPMPPAVAKQKAEEMQAKLQDLEVAHQRGEASEVRLNADEVNAGFQQSAVEQATAPDTSAPAQTVPGSGPEAAPEVKTVQIAFVGDHATGQFVTNFHGKDVYLTVSGRIGAQNGYATFEFTVAKIGDMPVPVSLLNPRLQEKLQEPENHEKLKLPGYVSDLRIENGQLVMVGK